jgi:hypothetical protein
MSKAGFRKEPPKGTIQKPETPLSGMRDKAIFAGWIGGLLLAGVLLWVFTQPVRVRITGESVNRILSSREDPRRLGNPIPRGEIHRNLIPLGTWYALENPADRNPAGRALVFSLAAGGGRIPCVALVSLDGRVEEFIHLNDPGEWMLNRLNGGTLRTYMRRIEGIREWSRREDAE